MMPGRRAQGAWRAAAALVLAAAVVKPAGAQDYYPYDDYPYWYDERNRLLEPGPSLPEGINGVIRPGAGERVPTINTLRDVFRTLQACWRPPEQNGFSGQEITLRMAFRRNGEIIGQPRITYYKPSRDRDRDREQREAFTRSVQDAFTRCTPLPFSEKLGAAVAGRIFNFRFSDTRPM